MQILFRRLYSNCTVQSGLSCHLGHFGAKGNFVHLFKMFQKVFQSCPLQKYSVCN